MDISNQKNSNIIIEKKVDELGSEFVKIKITKKREKTTNLKEKDEKKNEKDVKIEENNQNKPNNEIEKKECEENIKKENNEEFNLDNFNIFLQNNINIKSSSNNNKPLKSRLGGLKLKLNLGSGNKAKEIKPPDNNKDKNTSNDNKNEIDTNKNNIKKDNNDDINTNINIDNINNINDNEQKIKDPNIESSFILKQKFNKFNESQISYDVNSSCAQHTNEQHKTKKKFKLSLYELHKLALLGAGASGEVYLVQDNVTKKKLALKCVKYVEDEKTISQLETEVKLSNILKHENIVRIYATYFLKGKINFVMEYMNKGTISDLLKKVKKIPEKYTGLITAQLVKGMAYCQKEGRIIHRDLKPSNILVNSKGEIKISDFGVSTVVESSWSQKKTMIGTYIYMAPERIDADEYYINCDVWSLGIIVMECILGFYPYIVYNNNILPNSVWVVHELIENNPVPQLDQKIYSKELIDFANQCLIKDMKKRPTANKLLEHPFIKKYINTPKEVLANWLKNI